MYLVMGILNAWRNIFCLTRCSSITIHCLNIAWRRLASHFFGFLSWVNLAEHDAVPNLDILGTPTVCGSMVAGGRTPTATTPTSRAPHFVWVLERFGLETWCETEGVGFPCQPKSDPTRDVLGIKNVHTETIAVGWSKVHRWAQALEETAYLSEMQTSSECYTSWTIVMGCFSVLIRKTHPKW